MEPKTLEEYNELTHAIIGAALEVHRTLGPGLLEAVYEECLISELQMRGLQVDHQVHVPILYKGQEVGNPLIIDILVENSVIVELKTVQELQDIHSAQLLSYLRLTGNKLGLLINFNTVHLRDGLKRVANGL
ncbi:MAG: GxxExxY protein [Bacteroidaceae bacterium]|nr:GxxExxY protein [Bacteroidaceae bacterium]